MIAPDRNRERRVTLLHAIANTADRILYATDPPVSARTPLGHAADLLRLAGALVRDTLAGVPGDTLLELAGRALLWLEDLERERAAA